jgi:hypothetical protein
MIKLLLTAVLAATPQAKPATNNVCPVLGSTVDATSKVVVVRGQEYRICCGGCDKKIMAAPDTYLQKDGTPKNAAKAMGDHMEHHK